MHGQGGGAISRKPLGKKMQILAVGSQPKPTKETGQGMTASPTSCLLPHLVLLSKTLKLEVRAKQTADGSAQKPGNSRPPS